MNDPWCNSRYHYCCCSIVIVNDHHHYKIPPDYNNENKLAKCSGSWYAGHFKHLPQFCLTYDASHVYFCIRNIFNAPGIVIGWLMCTVYCRTWPASQKQKTEVTLSRLCRFYSIVFLVVDSHKFFLFILMWKHFGITFMIRLYHSDFQVISFHHTAKTVLCVLFFSNLTHILQQTK